MLKNVNLPNEDIVELVFTMDEEDRLTKDMIEQVTLLVYPTYLATDIVFSWKWKL